MNLYDHENESCVACGIRAVERTCVVCGLTAWIIDCGHKAQPRPLASGRADGSDGQNCYCTDCAEGNLAEDN